MTTGKYRYVQTIDLYIYITSIDHYSVRYNSTQRFHAEKGVGLGSSVRMGSKQDIEPEFDLFEKKP